VIKARKELVSEDSKGSVAVKDLLDQKDQLAQKVQLERRENPSQLR